MSKKTKSVGNGEGTLYYDKQVERWTYQYYYNGKRSKIGECTYKRSMQTNIYFQLLIIVISTVCKNYSHKLVF